MLWECLYECINVDDYDLVCCRWISLVFDTINKWEGQQPDMYRRLLSCILRLKVPGRAMDNFGENLMHNGVARP